MSNRNGLITNLTSVVIAILLVGGLYVRERFRASTASAALQSQTLESNIPDRLAAFPGYDWRAHGHTLILAVRHGCHFCEASAPFYKRLSELEKSGQIGDVHVIAIFPDEREVARNTLEKDGLTLEFIPAINLQAVGVLGTPTAILVDQDGRVLKTWAGQLKDRQETALLDTLRSVPRI